MRALVLAGLVLLGGCSLFRHSPPPPRANVHAVVGAPYQIDGIWRYPHEEYGVDVTGLAAVAPDRQGLTADGEIFDQRALAAGHRTLQLPAILRVTNLQNGRQVVLRLNDRGPADPGRLLSLTRRAATLLGITADATQIRVQMDDAETRQLAAGMVSDAPALNVAAAPRGAIASESLAPPAGASASGRIRVAASRAIRPGSTTQAATIPLRLPEVVTMVPPHPGSLYIDAGSFGRQDYARILARRLAFLGARLTTSYSAPRDRAYRIRIGPFADVAEAERMLQRTIRAGVNDAAIVVE